MSKPEAIVHALLNNDPQRALRLAASFPHLGPEKAIIQRGWAACQRPEFYRQIGKDPDQLIAEGAAALRRRYMTSSVES